MTMVNTYNGGTTIKRSIFMKPKIFISHITEEKELAILLKEEIERVTFGIADVFVSSDGESIGGGERWFDTIINNLKECNMLICIASEKSVNRPWIPFELGYCFGKEGTRTIPLCHSRMFPGQLPAPLNQLQALNFSEHADIKRILKYAVEITNDLAESTLPTNHFDVGNKFFEELERFEQNYTLNSKAWENIHQIDEKVDFLRGLFVKSNAGKNYEMTVSKDEFQKIEGNLKALEKLELIELDLEQYGNTAIRSDGFQTRFAISFSQKFKEIFE